MRYFRTMKRIVYLLSILCWLGCRPEATKPPPVLISEEKMILMLTEIHLAEGKVSKLNLRSVDSSKKAYNALEARIMKKYATDTSVYRQSYRYYLARPEAFNEMYKKVVQALEAKEKSGNLN
jgi:hypothetical protein